MNRLAICVFSAALMAAAAVNAQPVVYQTGDATDFFAVFDASTPAGTLYGDSGWFGSGGDAPVELSSITLGLATFGPAGPVAAGTTDIVFTFNDGDPSGLVFVPGVELYSTTITNVALPADDGNGTYFELTVDLPGVMTSGGFNNIGFSVGVENFNYDGLFGFQNRGDFNSLGFYTNNYSNYDPNTAMWSLYSFGPNNPADIGNFVMTVRAVPEPSGLLLFGAALGLVRVRRRA